MAILLKFVRFVNKYLGISPPDDSPTKTSITNYGFVNRTLALDSDDNNNDNDNGNGNGNDMVYNTTIISSNASSLINQSNIVDSYSDASPETIQSTSKPITKPTSKPITISSSSKVAVRFKPKRVSNSSKYIYTYQILLFCFILLL